jgi:hypothetical protein
MVVFVEELNTSEVVRDACLFGEVTWLVDFLTSYVYGYMKGSPGTAVKLLPCDHEVMSPSPENILFQKCRERLRT